MNSSKSDEEIWETSIFGRRLIALIVAATYANVHNIDGTNSGGCTNSFLKLVSQAYF